MKVLYFVVCCVAACAAQKTLKDCLKLLPKASQQSLSKESPGMLAHHVAKRSPLEGYPAGAKLNKGSHHQMTPNGLPLDPQELTKFLLLLPAETLNMLRMVFVPLLNTTLAVPANILEGMSNMNMTALPVFSANSSFGNPLNASWHHGNHSLGNPFNFTLPGMAHFNFSALVHPGFNLTSLGGLGNHTLSPRFGESLLQPVTSLLRGFHLGGADSSLPSQLDPSHLMRHVENLKRFLTASHTSNNDEDADSTTSTERPANTAAPAS